MNLPRFRACFHTHFGLCVANSLFTHQIIAPPSFFAFPTQARLQLTRTDININIRYHLISNHICLAPACAPLRCVCEKFSYTSDDDKLVLFDRVYERTDVRTMAPTRKIFNSDQIF